MDNINEIAPQNKPDLGLLIEVVQMYEHLYNLKHKDYKNTMKKEQSWLEISQIVNMSVDDCKKQWKNIRDKFMREKREKPSGSAAADFSWEFMGKMAFYEKFSKPRKTSTATPRLSENLAEPGYSSEPVSSPWSSMEGIMSPMESPMGSPMESPLMSPQGADEEVGEHEVDSQMSATEGATPKVKRGTKRKGDDLTSIVNAANKIAECLQAKRQEAAPTQNELFTGYVLSRLNEMTPEESRRRRKAILGVLEDL